MKYNIFTLFNDLYFQEEKWIKNYEAISSDV